MTTNLKKRLPLTVILFCLIMLIGAYLRVDFIRSVNHHLSHDSIHYDIMVRQLLETGVYAYKDTVPNAQVTPGYPWFLAAIYTWADYEHHDPLPTVRYIQIFLSLATLWLIYLIARLLSNEGAALLAMFAAAIYPSFVWTNGAILTEVLTTFLLVAYVYLQLQAFRKQTRLWSVAAGIACGLTVLTRPEFLPLPVAIHGFYWLWKKDFRSVLRLGLLTALGLVLVLSPWVVRNMVSLNELVIASTQVNPFAAGTYPNKNYDDGLVDRHGKTQMEVAKERLKVGFTKHPWTFLKWYTVGKLGDTYSRMFFGTGHAPFYKVIPVIPHGAVHLAIIGFGVFALAATLWRWRNLAGVLAVILIVMSVIRLGFVPEYRYNYTVMPFVIVLDCIVGAALVQWLWSSRWRGSLRRLKSLRWPGSRLKRGMPPNQQEPVTQLTGLEESGTPVVDPPDQARSRREQP